MDKRMIISTLGLLDSMIKGRERHTDKSRQAVKDAIKELIKFDIMEDAKRQRDMESLIKKINGIKFDYDPETLDLEVEAKAHKHAITLVIRVIFEHCGPKPKIDPRRAFEDAHRR